MSKAIAIDPGIYKCGLIIADLTEKKVCKAEVIQSSYLLSYVKKIYQNHHKLQFLIGNGTSSKKFIKGLSEFVPNLILAEEKNSTYRAKTRYFEIFPLSGFKYFLPREIFLLNKNLDALAALIIMEDHYNCKFEMSKTINTKTWLK
tara:strand:+ start:191 stop:628 length:438 start_codon:yes stop_codon:yes gene_type:complete